MKEYRNLLVFVGTKDPHAALKRAGEIAEENQARVTLMDVVKPVASGFARWISSSSSEELNEQLRQEREQTLTELAKECGFPLPETQTLVTTGDPAHEICAQVISGKHDLVLKTADGVSFAGHTFGSIAKALMRACPCPVWVLKPQVHGPFDQVLAAIDLDAEDDVHRKLNDNILEIAYSIAERDQANLHIVSAWDLWMEQALRRRAGDEEIDAALAKREQAYQAALDDLLSSPPWDQRELTVHMQRGVPAAVIHSVAEEVEADLIVMGTICRVGVAGLLIGNTAENVTSHATCSVLSLKPEGFQSPVNG